MYPPGFRREISVGQRHFTQISSVSRLLKRGRPALGTNAETAPFSLFHSSGQSAGNHTQVAWEVDDTQAPVAELQSRGLVFEEYDLPGLAMYPASP